MRQLLPFTNTVEVWILDMRFSTKTYGSYRVSLRLPLKPYMVVYAVKTEIEIREHLQELNLVSSPE